MKKKSLIILFLAFLQILLSNSCKKDEQITPNTSNLFNGSLKKDEVSKFLALSGNYHSDTLLLPKDTLISKSRKAKIIWKYSKSYSIDVYDVFEVPIQYSINMTKIFVFHDYPQC